MRSQIQPDYLLLSSILLHTIVSFATALPQVANYPPPVVARPPGRIAQKESESLSFVKVLREYSLPISMAVVGMSLLTDQEPGSIV
jgi:hypothetical protein